MELLDVIKFEGDDQTLVWKHPHEDFNTKSVLIVHESQEAIFFKDGKALDLFGPGKYELETENIPLLRNLINIPTMGVSPFHCEVYFINKITSMNMEWGTNSRFQVLDPHFQVPLNVGASGSMEFVIDDSRKFLIKVVGTQQNVTSGKVMKYFREKTVTKVKSYLATIMTELSYVNVTQHLDEISEALNSKLNEEYKEYGIKLINFYVSTIIVPEEDTLKIKEVLNKKMEYGTFNINWADDQIVQISKKYAENPGSQDNVGGMMAQVPIAMAFGQMLKNNIMGDINNPLTEQSNIFKQKKEENKNGFYCPDCGTNLVKEAKFCYNCGKSFSNELSCPQCGQKISEEYKFCMYCGCKLE